MSNQWWTTVWEQTPLVLFVEGMVVADTSHEDKALQAINSLLAFCHYYGHDCIPMTSFSLGDVTISQSGSLSSWGGPIAIGRPIMAVHKNLSEKTLLKVFRSLEQCNDKDLSAQLRLWHAGCVHFLSGENLQAFILGWTTIENLLGKLWADYLHEHAIIGGRLQKLTSPQGGFTIDHIIESLSLAGRIDTAKYSRLQNLRKTRNNTVHRGTEPPLDATGECLGTAKQILSERLQMAVP